VLAIVRCAKQSYLNQINKKENGDEGKEENGRKGMLERVSVHFGEGWRGGDGIHVLGVNDIKSCSGLLDIAFNQSFETINEKIRKLIPDLTVARKYVGKKKVMESTSGKDNTSYSTDVSPVESPGRLFNYFFFILFF
jgi:hypothetical protein